MVTLSVKRDPSVAGQRRNAAKLEKLTTRVRTLERQIYALQASVVRLSGLLED